MARVTVEDCIDKIDNRFDLVLMASHRARLLISGRHEEIRSSSIALRADGVEAGFRMRQLPVPVGTNRAAAVGVRIDQRGEGIGALQQRIEPQAQLSGDAEIRP